jgi:hypothetical protein
MRFVCHFVNQNGQQQTALVELSEAEIADVMRQRNGGPDHPLAKTYASMRAGMPAGFWTTAAELIPDRAH